jgi:class 3 adenylate cyclase
LAREHLTRRLVAVFAADVAGYSRLTGADEEGTHVRLKERLRGLLVPKIAAHFGTVVKNTGDGLLAEFDSVVDAVRCAVDVQHGMSERNAAVPPNDRIEFRIGINVGESGMTAIYSATRSMSRYASKRSRSPGAFACPMMLIDMYETRSMLVSTMPANKG